MKINYRTGVKISVDEFNALNIKFNKNFPAWNYTISPLI
ncbi:MAG: hypothetical protein HQK53_07360 [Oligoflexia bacterium]|nr:hypothetical protein [Oligoflexia bacterium]